MAFNDLAARWEKAGKYPKGTSERFIHLDALQRLLDSTIYRILPFPYEQEENGVNNYIDLRERRPAVIYNMPKIIVDQTAALTFGESHAPSVRIADTDAMTDNPEKITDTHEAFERVVEALDLDAVMLEAMRRGSVGSVVVVLRQMPDKAPYLDLLDGKYCTPFFDPEDPRKLKTLDYIYSVTVEDLRLAGYDISSYDVKKQPYFIKQTFALSGTLVSLPLEQKRYEKLGEKVPNENGAGESTVQWQKDDERSYTNPFSFFPAHWIRNLEQRGNIDGACTFECVTDITIEISYLLSQIGRGYHYTADPLLVQTSKGPMTTIPLGGPNFEEGGDGTGESQPMVKSPARKLVLPPDSDAKYLDIAAAGLVGAGKHVSQLREYGLEVLSGMKSEAKDEGGTQSGRALHLMHQALVWLVERFRTSYGVRGYLPVLRMVLTGLQERTLVIPIVDEYLELLDPEQALRLMWQPWSAPSGNDMKAELEGLSIAAGSTNNFPKAILPDTVIAQKAAAVIGISDQNRVAAELQQAQAKEKPVTPRDQLDAQVQMHTEDVAVKKIAAEKPHPAPTSGK